MELGGNKRKIILIPNHKEDNGTEITHFYDDDPMQSAGELHTTFVQHATHHSQTE